MTHLFLALILAMTLINPTPVAADDNGGYLFLTFKGEHTPMTEQVYFATSKDGRDWKALNHENPVLVSTLGEKGVRDPFIIRHPHDAKYYIIATDLSIHLTRHNWGRAVTRGSHALIIWESTDLVNWSEPRRVEVAPEDAGCTWAPEAIYDEQKGDFLVFWASTTARDDFKKHRIWAARTTDFKTFSEPFIYIEKDTTVIDTTIVQENDTYVRFTKDERDKAITMETAPALDGPWKDVDNFSLARLQGYEGPQAYMIQPDADPPVWCLIIDNYARGRGYQPYITHNLTEGQFEHAAQDFSFPFHFRHGSVLSLTPDEYQRLTNADFATNR